MNDSFYPPTLPEQSAENCTPLSIHQPTNLGLPHNCQCAQLRAHSAAIELELLAVNEPELVWSQGFLAVFFVDPGLSKNGS